MNCKETKLVLIKKTNLGRLFRWNSLISNSPLTMKKFKLRLENGIGSQTDSSSKTSDKFEELLNVRRRFVNVVASIYPKSIVETQRLLKAVRQFGTHITNLMFESISLSKSEMIEILSSTPNLKRLDCGLTTITDCGGEKTRKWL